MNHELFSGSRRLGFMIPIVVIVLIFVICCGVVASVFLRSAEETAMAGRLSDCIQLCRNQAELRRSPDAPLLESGTVLYFDETYHPASREEAAFSLEILETLEETPVGCLRRDTLTAACLDGAAEFTLDVAVYLPEGR